jgi:hypothetical protein
MDGFAHDIRDRIHFARSFASAQVFVLASRKDYVYAVAQEFADFGFYIVDLYAFKNIGRGATKIKG